MKIDRKIKTQILEKVKPNKVVILYGARQVGKTTLIKEIVDNLSLDTLFINADTSKYRDILSSQDEDELKKFIGQKELLIIDEAQRIENIGINLKIIVDQIPDIRVIVTGSSSFDLANKINEPLTGRKHTFELYPISVLELKESLSDFDINAKLEELLIYGSYPDTLNQIGYSEKQDYLIELEESYLYKDIFAISEIRKSPQIKKLLQSLSYQIGSEVSINELSNSLDLDNETVNRYIDLLEKNFVIFSLSGFSRNLRKEITKSYKYYFYDLGIRNSLIDNFKPILNRNDVGALWENFLILERLKYLKYSRIHNSRYFWRTYTGAEVDYVEERESILSGYEIKWGNKTPRPPATWKETYNASWKIINRENWIDFVS